MSILGMTGLDLLLWVSALVGIGLLTAAWWRKYAPRCKAIHPGPGEAKGQQCVLKDGHRGPFHWTERIGRIAISYSWRVR